MNFIEGLVGFKKRHRVLTHVFFWVAVLFLYISADKYHDGRNFSLLLSAGGVVLFSSIQIIASYFLAYFIIPLLFYKKRYLPAAVYFVAGSYAMCALSRYLTIHVGEPMAGVAAKAWENDQEIFTDVSKLLFVYFFQIFSIAFVFLFIKLLIDQTEMQKRTLLLEKAKAETELKLLKAQLNPHFLFNTLNNIYSLSLHNSPVTPEAIARLSNILDHILYRCNNVYVPLSTEIDLLKNYIGLEKLRYDRRLHVSFNTAVDCDMQIAPLLMLSIVENAFKHGAGQDTGSPVINIDIAVANNVFTYVVANSIAGKSHAERGEKIGLPNLRKQLELLYPGTHTLNIGQTDDLFTVSLIITLQPNKQPA